MISVSSFNLEYNKKKDYYVITTDEVVPCPYCGGLLSYRDSVFRNVKNLLSEVRRFLLRRLLCQVCEKLHRELPDIIQPYKHYETDVIQAVIEDSEDMSSCGADNATIRRWKAEFASAKPGINQKLSSVYARMTNKTVPLAATENILDRIKGSKKRWYSFVISLLINSGHKICTEFAFLPPANSDKVSSSARIFEERGRKNDKAIEDTS